MKELNPPQVGHLQRSPHTLNDSLRAKSQGLAAECEASLSPLTNQAELESPWPPLANPFLQEKKEGRDSDIYEDSRHKARTTII